jgi:hypothetical protein
MTIPAASAGNNIGFSTIAAEKGIGNSNLSLGSLSAKEVKMDTVTGQGYGSTYALAKEKWIYGANDSRDVSMIVTSAQGTGSAGLNTHPYSISEWAGYDPQRPNIGTSSIPVAKFTDTTSHGACNITSLGSIEIYCKKVSGVIKFYVNKGSHGNAKIKTYNNNSTFNTLSYETQIGEMVANTTDMIPSGCTMGNGVGGSSGSTGTAFHSGAAVTATTGGSTSTTNLGSTKIGYKVSAGGIAEGGSYAQFTMFHWKSARFNWTWPDSPGNPSGTAYEDSYTDIIVGVYLDGSHGAGQGC